MAIDTTKNLNQNVPESFVRANVDAPIYNEARNTLKRDIYDPQKSYTTAQFAPEIFTTATDEMQRKMANESVINSIASPVQKLETDVNADQARFIAEENAKVNTVPVASTAIEGEVVTNNEKSGTISALERANKMIEEQRSAYLTLEADFAAKTKPPEMSFEQAYRSLMTEQGIESDQKSLALIQSDIRDSEARLRERVQAQSGQGEGIPLGVIAGRVGEIEKQEMTRIDYLRRQEKVAADRVNQKLGIVDSIMKYKGIDYTNAVNDYNDQYKKAIEGFKMMGNFASDIVEIDLKIEQEKERIAGIKDKAKQDEAKQMLDLYKQNQLDVAKERDDARANLQILFGQVTTGGVRVEDLTPAEKTEWGRLEMKAGIPVGTFLNMTAKNNGFEMVTNVQRYDEKGNGYLDIIFRNPRTGELKKDTQFLGMNAEKKLSMDNTKSLIDDRTATNLAGAKPKEGSYWSNYGPEQFGSPHKDGIDLDGKITDPIYTPVTGEVVSVKTEAETGGKKGWGNQVIIEAPDGNRILLNHLDGFGVKVGDQVVSGQPVGTMGNTGNVIPGKGGDGSHLDVTIKRPNGTNFTTSQARAYIDKNYTVMTKERTKEDTFKEFESVIGQYLGTKSTSGFVDKALTQFPVAASVMGEYKNYISAKDYIMMRDEARVEGITPQEFDKKFNTYVDPSRESDYKLITPLK